MASKGPKREAKPPVAAPSTPPADTAATAVAAPPVRAPARPAAARVSAPKLPLADKIVEAQPAVGTPPDVVPAPLVAPAPATAPVQAATKMIEAVEAATPPAIETLATPATKEVTTMATNFENATAAATSKNAAMLGEMNERTKTAMEKSTKMVEEMADFAKGNVEALVESSRIAAKGAEDILKYTADYSRTSIEQANTTAKKFASVKSPTEFFQLQSEWTKQMLDAVVTESSKFTESYLKLMGEAAQPISNRVSVAVEKAKITAA